MNLVMTGIAKKICRFGKNKTMKNILVALLLLLSFSSFAQDSCKYIQTVPMFDDIADGTITSMKSPVQIHNMHIDIIDGSGHDKSIIFSITDKDANCITKKSEINIIFTDSSKLALNHAFDPNCEGKYEVFLGGFFGLEDKLKLLKTKKIKTIGLNTNAGLLTETLTEANALNIMNSFKCLSK